MRTGIATPRPLPLPEMPGLWLLLLQPRGRVRGLSRKREGFVKTGTVALPDPVNGRLIQAQPLGGFLEAEPNQFHGFYLVVNRATAQDIDDVLRIFDDLADISAILQMDASQQGEDSQG
jgi:hypothetical protein